MNIYKVLIWLSVWMAVTIEAALLVLQNILISKDLDIHRLSDYIDFIYLFI